MDALAPDEWDAVRDAGPAHRDVHEILGAARVGRSERSDETEAQRDWRRIVDAGRGRYDGLVGSGVDDTRDLAPEDISKT